MRFKKRFDLAHSSAVQAHNILRASQTEKEKNNSKNDLKGNKNGSGSGLLAKTSGTASTTTIPRPTPVPPGEKLNNGMTVNGIYVSSSTGASPRRLHDNHSHHGSGSAPGSGGAPPLSTEYHRHVNLDVLMLSALAALTHVPEKPSWSIWKDKELLERTTSGIHKS